MRASPQIENPIFCLIRKSQIRTFLRCVSPLIADFFDQIFFYISVPIWTRAFVKREIMYFRICRSFKSTEKLFRKSQKRFGPQIENRRIATFAEGPLISETF